MHLSCQDKICLVCSSSFLVYRCEEGNKEGMHNKLMTLLSSFLRAVANLLGVRWVGVASSTPPEVSSGQLKVKEFSFLHRLESSQTVCTN